MYEPTQTEIDDKVKEALAKRIIDEDVLIDALIACLPLVIKTLNCHLSDLVDARFDLKKAIEDHIIKLRDLEHEALQCLIAEKTNIPNEDYRKEIVRDFDRAAAREINKKYFNDY